MTNRSWLSRETENSMLGGKGARGLTWQGSERFLKLVLDGVEWNGDLMTGKFLNRPEREEIPENIKEQLIVELYSK